MKRNHKLKTLLGLFVLTLVVGTWAFFSAATSIDNVFATKKYGGETVEKFTPKKDWEPGGNVTKEVQVKNTGNYPLYVRIKLEEKWQRDGATFDNFTSANKALFFPANDKNGVKNGSAVYKNLCGEADNTWKYKEDGYFYYSSLLKPEKMTSVLMDSVTLCADANMGEYSASEIKYALVDANKSAEDLTDADYTLDVAPEQIPEGKVLYQKKVVSLNSNKAGYAGATYTLTVTTELLQANEDAATEKGWTYIPE